MSIALPANATVVFMGDSITDADRLDGGEWGLGSGYVREIASAEAIAHPDRNYRWINRGVSGERVRDLRGRWERDCIAHSPDVVSIMVGINDTWRRYDSGETTSVTSFEADYRECLTMTRDRTDAQLLLIEPFLMPVDPAQWTWREDLDPRIQIVRALAAEFDATLLCADGRLAQLSVGAEATARLTFDGVHLTPAGHQVLAQAWLGLTTG